MKLAIKVIVEFLVMLNGFLCSMGITQFQNITGETIYFVASLIAALVIFVYTIWKNHNFTDAGKQAQEILNGIKGDTVEVEDGDEYTVVKIAKHNTIGAPEEDVA